MNLRKKDGTKIPFRCKNCGGTQLVERVDAVQIFRITGIDIDDNGHPHVETELSDTVLDPESIFMCGDCEHVIGNFFENIVKYIEEEKNE